MAKILENDAALKEHAKEDLGIEIDSFGAEDKVRRGRECRVTNTDCVTKKIKKSRSGEVSILRSSSALIPPCQVSVVSVYTGSSRLFLLLLLLTAGLAALLLLAAVLVLAR